MNRDRVWHVLELALVVSPHWAMASNIDADEFLKTSVGLVLLAIAEALRVITKKKGG